MSKKYTKAQIATKANRFVNCKTNREIELLLQIPRLQLAQTAFAPQYYYFKIPKPKGGSREIEAPETYLKIIQRKLNEYLQYVYYGMCIIPSYGFIINPRRQEPKNIVSNAQAHLGNPYMLNIDFDDFFHQISQEEVFQIFRDKPFNYSKTTAHTLAKICTNKGRLPMGAPTSPALSNFACIDLDNDLEKWASDNQITYTRFVDDLSFSSKQAITSLHFSKIKAITDRYQLKIEPTKTKYYGKDQEKTVTGIVVGKTKVSLALDYYKELDKDLDRLQKVMEVHIITGQIHKQEGIKKYKQEVMGKINFIATVLGYDNEKYTTYMQKYENALNPPDKDQLSLRWVRFSNYTHF